MSWNNFAWKLINTVADATAGGAAGMLASGHPVAAGAAIGALAAGLVTQSFIQAKGEGDAARQAESTLRQLIQKQGSLKAALRQIAAEQDAGQIFAAEEARKMLIVIEVGQNATEEALNRQESLLIHVGEWISRWCEQHGLSQEQFTARIEAKFDTLLEMAVEGRQEHRQTSTEQLDLHRQTHSKLDELKVTISRRPFDAHNEVDKAVEHLKKRSFDVAIHILSELRQHHWNELGPRERFRVLANLAHAANRKDGDFRRAAVLFFEASDADPHHEQAKALCAIAHLSLGNRDRAHSLAEQAVAASPNSALPYAVRVRTFSDDMTFEEVEASVPGHLREDPEIAFALSVRVMVPAKTEQRGPSLAELDTSERWARLAFAADPQPLFKSQVGMILVESERQRAIARTTDVNVKDPTRLREGIRLLSEALQEYGKYPDPEIHGRIHLARGTAHALLRENDRAVKDFEAAYGAAPNDHDIIFQQSIGLHERHDPDGAISLLRKNLVDEIPHWSRLTLCRMLVRRGRAGDRDEAISLLKIILPALPEADTPLQMQTLGLLTALLDGTKARETIESLPASINAAILNALKATALTKDGRLKEAEEAIKRSVAALTVDAHPDVKSHVAGAAQMLGRNDLALPLLKKIVPDDRIIAESPNLLAAAEALGEDTFILDFCGRLRANHQFDWRFVSHEAGLLQEYNATDRAISVLQEFIAAEPASANAKHARVQLSDIAIRANRSELIVRDVSLLPRIEDANAMWGEATARVLLQFDPTAAVRFAYKLLRRHYNRPHAHRALIACMMPSKYIARLPVHPTADNDAAVRYRERGKTEDEWWVIETEPDPDLSRREISPSHPIALALDGKRPGGEESQFYIDRNGIQDRVGDVIEIVDKHVYRLRDCADHYRERFPQEPFFVLPIRAAKPDGTPDLEPILRSIEQQDQSGRMFEAEWSLRRFPVASLATVTHGAVVQTVAYLAGRRGVRQWCCLGSLDELNAATATLESCKALVLDPTALSSLFLSGVYKRIKRGSMLFVTSAGTVGEFRQLHEAQASAPVGSKGQIAFINGQHVWLDTDEEARRKSAEMIAEFLMWISENVQSEDGLVVADLPVATRKPLLGTIGRPSTECLMLAQKPGRALWTDDVWMANLGKGGLITESVWSQIAIQSLVNRGQADEVAADEMTLWLLGSEFFFVRASADIIIRAARKSDWNCYADPLRTILRIFSVDETEEIGLFVFVAQTIKCILQHAPDHCRAADVIGSILDRLNVTLAGNQIINRLRFQRVFICWPNTSWMLGMHLAIERWKQRQRLNYK